MAPRTAVKRSSRSASGRSAKDTDDAEHDSEPEEEESEDQEEEEEEEDEYQDDEDSESQKSTRKRSSANNSQTKPDVPIKKHKPVEPEKSKTEGPVHESTLNFLRLIAENNDREWMRRNKQLYESAKKNFESIVGKVQTAIRQFDPTIPDKEPKNLVFRLNRDMRFSQTKEPYKTSFGAVFSRRDKKSPHACYYLHLEPGKSFVGGGMYRPDGPVLHSLRESIAEDALPLKRVLQNKEFQRHFGKDPFADQERLKTAPKGVAKDHKEIELLKLKSFAVHHGLDDEQVTSTEFIDLVATVCHSMSPFVAILNEMASL